MRYELVTDVESFPVYAPDHNRELEPFVGRQVVVPAKVVDLSNEGFGTELWIGSIGHLSADPRSVE